MMKKQQGISHYSVLKNGLRPREYYACNVVTVSNEGQEDWYLLLNFRKLYEMYDSAVRPTRSGIILPEMLSREVILNIKDLKEVVNKFPSSMLMRVMN